MPEGGLASQTSKLKRGLGNLSGNGMQEQSSKKGGREMQGVGVTEKLDKIYGVLTEIKNQNNTFN